MKAIYPKFAALSFAAILFAACSDSTSDGGNNGGNNSNVTPSAVTSLDLTAQSIDASRVDNYKLATTKAAYNFSYTRAGETSFVESMPTVPAEPATCLNLNNAANLSGNSYVISGQKTLDFSGKTITNSTIFVHSACTIVYDQTTTLSGSTIVLQGSATLKYTGTGDMVPAGNIVYCASPKAQVIATGDIKINGEFYAEFRGATTDDNEELSTGLGAIKETTATEKEKSITPTQNITFGSTAKVYIDGSIRAKELTVAEGANVYSAYNLFNADENKNGNGNIAGNLKLGGFIKSANLTVTGNLIAGAAVRVTDKMTVNTGGVVQAAYINVSDYTEDGDKSWSIKDGDATLSLNGTGKILISDGNVIVANNLVTDNASAGQITLQGESTVAVIKANKFTNNSSNTKIQAFATSGNNSMFLFQFKNNYNGTTPVATFEDLDFTATFLDYDKTSQNNCIQLVDKDHKKYGYEWVGSIETLKKGYKLDLVAAEEPGTDGQSASCIQTTGSNIYVGYHTYGDGTVGGKIERLTMSNNTLSLNESLKADDIDYNHMLLDGSALYLAGSQQGTKDSDTKAIGAFLGKVALSSGSIGNKIELYSVNQETSKVDANCVGKYNNNYVVATTKGFTVLDNDFNYKAYAGAEGKYVVANGSNLYTLDLTNNGQMKSYTSTDLTTAASTVNTTSAITPTDNKAVMAIDGNVMYVCKGENGIDKIDLSSGTATHFWTCPTFVAHDATTLNNGSEYVKGHCNGIAVKGDFIYVAHGSYGLVVLNKEGKMICHRKSDNGKSANFVTVDENGYIYVAYGKSRVHVFKLTGSEPMTE